MNMESLRVFLKTHLCLHWSGLTNPPTMFVAPGRGSDGEYASCPLEKDALAPLFLSAAGRGLRKEDEEASLSCWWRRWRSRWRCLCGGNRRWCDRAMTVDSTKDNTSTSSNTNLAVSIVQSASHFPCHYSPMTGRTHQVTYTSKRG